MSDRAKNDRINNLIKLMKKDKFDALLIDSTENIFYLTGFTGTAGKFLITADNNYFFTDGRYVEQAAAEVENCEIIEVKDNYEDEICKILNKTEINKLHFESKVITHHQYQKYAQSF